MDMLEGRLRHLRENYIISAAPLLIILGVALGNKSTSLTWVAAILLILLTINWLVGFFRA